MSFSLPTGPVRLRLAMALGVGGLIAVLAQLAAWDYGPSSVAFHGHGFCYFWQTDLVALHVVSDGVIGVSYVAISGTLIYLVWRARTLLPFSWVFVAFGGFIVACGATHFMEIWTLWRPVFWLSGDVKIVTALASVATAIVLPPLIPRVLEVVQEAHLSGQRRMALEQARSELEQRVEERTAQLQAALQRAEEAVRTKEVFLSNVSHELRTPLNAILGWSRMLNEPDLQEEFVRRGLRVIDRNASIQAQLVEDLLDISRLGEGTLRLHTRPVDLVRVVADALEVIRPAADAKQVTLEWTERPAHVAVVGDARRLQQVVWNLLSNAVKFTPSGGLVAVSVTHRTGWAIIVVRDTGIGIEPGFMPRLFERFTQADSTTTRTHPGAGLGLAIARQLVELHGGTIQAGSGGAGTGATFRVELPMHPAIEVVAGAEEPRRTLVVPDLAGVRILVVDDEADTRETLGLMLARTGAAVTTAESVDAALELLQARSFDVLLSDLAMPRRDGYDLIRHVRHSVDEHIRQLPAIAISAYVRDEDRALAISTGFHMHVAKPVSPDELMQAVGAVVTR
ncbi:MAG TPA: ATP-binding protein [Vicinamibacterales bacterium]|nr:ATP-binding protein [Vicinamibacterales bacterium]